MLTKTYGENLLFSSYKLPLFLSYTFNVMLSLKLNPIRLGEVLWDLENIFRVIDSSKSNHNSYYIVGYKKIKAEYSALIYLVNSLSTLTS